VNFFDQEIAKDINIFFGFWKILKILKIVLCGIDKYKVLKLRKCSPSQGITCTTRFSVQKMSETLDSGERLLSLKQDSVDRNHKVNK
jgi:hypothetical protein